MGRLTIGKSHYQEQTSALVFLQSKFFSVLIEFFIEFFKYKTAVLRKNAVSLNFDILTFRYGWKPSSSSLLF